VKDDDSCSDESLFLQKDGACLKEGAAEISMCESSHRSRVLHTYTAGHPAVFALHHCLLSSCMYFGKS
jgi:hypothetical protein